MKSERKSEKSGLYSWAVLLFVLPVIGCQTQADEPYDGPVQTVTVSAANFQEIVLDSPIPVVVDAGAQWCGPCRAMDPIVERLAAKYKGKAVVGKLDLEENKVLAIKYDIQGIPTFLFFKDGELVDRVSGMQSIDRMSDRLNRILPAGSSSSSD